VDVLLVLDDVLVVLRELLVQKGEAARYLLGLLGQILDDVVVRQVVQVADHLLGVRDEAGDELGVQLGVLDLLLVV
jgi:hypothetical protein